MDEEANNRTEQDLAACGPHRRTAGRYGQAAGTEQPAPVLGEYERRRVRICGPALRASPPKLTDWLPKHKLYKLRGEARYETEHLE